MTAYLVLGHGSESLTEERPIVPAGSALVVTEECGALGRIPHRVYPLFADPANKALFADPVRNKVAIEALLGQKIRVYRPGQRAPSLHYTLISTLEGSSGLEPSGLYTIPTPSFIYHPGRKGAAQYHVSSSEKRRAYEGSILEGASVSQAALFSERPGVYYSLLCRAAVEEQDRMIGLIRSVFPGMSVKTILPFLTVDPINAIREWIAATVAADAATSLTEQQLAVIREVEAILAAIEARRRASGSPLVDPSFHAVMTLLALKRPDPTRLEAAIAALGPVNTADPTGITPLLLAARMGHRDAAIQLLARGSTVNVADEDGLTPLIAACTTDSTLAMLLIDAGADVRAAAQDGDTTLHAAAAAAAAARPGPLISRLLAAGVDPNRANVNGDTPLHFAADHGWAETVALLLAGGADPRIMNNDHETALMFAAEKGAAEAAELLIPVTDLSVQSVEGKTALEYAIEEYEEDMALRLLEAGAPVTDWSELRAVASNRDMPRLLSDVRRRFRRKTRNFRSEKRRRGTHRSPTSQR